MAGFVDEPDEIVETAYAVLEGQLSEGTEGIRRVEREDEPAVYRLDPDAAGEVAAATESGEVPDGDVVRWRASADQVEQERERRGLHD